MQQSGIHSRLADRIAGSLGIFGDHRKFLASTPCVLGGNLLARYGGWLLCQCVQKPDVSLHPHRTTVSNSGDSVSFVGPDARQAHRDLDRCSRGNWNRVLAGMALCPKTIHYWLQFLTSSFGMVLYEAFHGCGSARRTRVSVDTLTSLRRALQNRLLLFLNFGTLTLGHLLLHMHFAQITG